MLNETQITEIRNYLIDKKLSVDILMEVQDHFVSQIQNLMHEENLNFEDAFGRTLQTWKTDFKEYWDDSWEQEEKGYFMRNIARQIWVSTIKNTVLYSMLTCIFIGVIANVFSNSFFRFFIIYLMVFATLFPGVYYFIQFKKFKLLKNYDNYILSLYQMPLVIFLGMLGLLITYIPKTSERSDLLYNFLRFETGWLNLEFALGISFIIISGIFFFLSGKEYVKRIEKIKPFLRYLQLNS